MKIITKKSVIFAALAIALLATALIISCNAPTLDGISDKEEPSKPGTGKVRLTINNRNASRTIVPTFTDNVPKYLVILTGKVNGSLDGTSNTNTFYATVSGSTVNDVPVGTYTSAQVFAYVKDDADLDDTDGSTYATYAIGDSTANTGTGGNGFTITGVGSPPNLGTYTVSLYTPGTGNGSFAYNITNNTSNRLATASFVVKGRGGTSDLNSGGSYAISTYGSEVPVLASLPSGASTIPSGYYNVIFTLKDTDNQVVNFFEILHVYKNMKSLYKSTFIASIFPDALSPPAVGNVAITINIPEVAVVEGALDAGGDSNVGIVPGAPTDVVRNVNIKKGASRSLTFVVNTPSSGVTFTNWCDGLMNPITPGNGISISDDLPTTQSFTISFDTTNGSFPLAIDGSPNGIQLVLALSGSVPFSTPLINIRFIP